MLDMRPQKFLKELNVCIALCEPISELKASSATYRITRCSFFCLPPDIRECVFDLTPTRQTGTEVFQLSTPQG